MINCQGEGLMILGNKDKEILQIHKNYNKSYNQQNIQTLERGFLSYGLSEVCKNQKSKYTVHSTKAEEKSTDWMQCLGRSQTISHLDWSTVYNAHENKYFLRERKVFGL